MNWFPAELHCHTIHSDGKMTVKELMENAHRRGLSVIALTDHNTDSGFSETAGYDNVIRGYELTTYYGHIVTLVCSGFADWRVIGKDDGDKLLREIHTLGGISGIAHPYRVGWPVGTGCHFDYKIKDKNLIDYYEVWYGQNPTSNPANDLAFCEWVSMLDGGARISPVFGLDWHRVEQVPEFSGKPEAKYIAVTWLGSDVSADASSALEALRRGRTAVSLGPCPEFVLKQGGEEYVPGDTVLPGVAEVSVGVLPSPVLSNSVINISGARIIGRGGRILSEVPLTYGNTCRMSLTLAPGWISAQLTGEIDGLKTIIAMTAPIYISHRTMITAHSGCEGTAPNSAEHIMAALSSGAEALEIDVRRREDGLLYLSHDNPGKDGAEPLTLAECFKMVYPHPPMRINCDVKEPGIAGDILELARDCGMGSRILFTGELTTDEGVSIGATESEWWVNQQNSSNPVNDLAAAIEKMNLSGSQVLNLRHTLVTPGSPAALSGQKLSVWTADKEEDIRRLIRLGVYNITTRCPVTVVRLRGEYENAQG